MCRRCKRGRTGTSATGAAAIAIMTINAPVQKAFSGVLQFLMRALREVFLPHLLWGSAVFMVGGLAVFRFTSGPFENAPWLLAAWGIWLLFWYGLAALVYTFCTAGVFAMRAVCAKVEDLLYAFFAAVKENLAQKIENMDEGLAKDQARVLMKNSISEVAALLKTYKLRSVPGALAAVFLSLLTFAARSVLVARLMQFSGATVSLSAVFASRATLVGAIFLNLRLICSVLLWILYLCGAAFTGLNLLALCMGR